MSKSTRDMGGTNVSVWQETPNWGAGTHGVSGRGQGRSHRTLDPRKRVAPPLGGEARPKKKPKARSSVSPW